ncbi:IclR family transcriptional regulator domain-containing protein [Streptomyces sp. NPDC055681]
MSDEKRVYRAGPVLELAAHSQSQASRLRAAALPHLRRLVDLLDETANLTIRTGDTAVHRQRRERTGAAGRLPGGDGVPGPPHDRRPAPPLLSSPLLSSPLLSELDDAELAEVYSAARYRDRPADRPNFAQLRSELELITRNGFAVNQERSERGLVAVGVPVRDRDGTAEAGLSVSMPSVRYDPHGLRSPIATLSAAARALEADLAAAH